MAAKSNRKLETARTGIRHIARAFAYVLVFGLPGMAFAGGVAPDHPVLIVVASRDFDFPEYRRTTDVLAGQDCPFVVASTDTTQAKAFNDSLIKPNLLLSDVVPADYSALLLLGGVGSILFWNDSTTLALVHDFANLPEPVVAAIGLAPLILAKAGLLNGRTVAVYNDPKAAQILTDNGAKFSFRDVVTDGRFITANGADAAPKFARAIVRRIETGK